MKSKELKKTDADVGNTNKWVLPKSGNPRPIGMLPRAVGFSGCLPVLDVNNVPEKVPGLLGRKEKWKLKQCSAMRPIKLNFGQNNVQAVETLRSVINVHSNLQQCNDMIKKIPQGQPENT
ncbi:hypothetical protein ACFX15_029610 [Malus domestica]